MTFLLTVVVAAGVLLARTVHVGRWRHAGWPARMHLSFAWTLMVLGLVHVVATSYFFTSLSGAALWFASGGIAMALTGSLNVLQRLYATVAPGLSPVCLAGNIAMTVLAAAFISIAGARVVREPQFVMLFSLLLVGTWLSLRAGAATISTSKDSRRL